MNSQRSLPKRPLPTQRASLQPTPGQLQICRRHFTELCGVSLAEVSFTADLVYRCPEHHRSVQYDRQASPLILLRCTCCELGSSLGSRLQLSSRSYADSPSLASWNSPGWFDTSTSVWKLGSGAEHFSTCTPGSAGRHFRFEAAGS